MTPEQQAKIEFAEEVIAYTIRNGWSGNFDSHIRDCFWTYENKLAGAREQQDQSEQPEPERDPPHDTNLHLGIRLSMRDPSYQDNSGRLYPGDLDANSVVRWVQESEACSHHSTMCLDCWRDWNEGYIGELVMIGTYNGVETLMPLGVKLDDLQAMLDRYSNLVELLKTISKSFKGEPT
jgi:hypothetical protein